MITKYDFESVFETEAMTERIEYGEALPYFEVSKEGKGFRFSFSLEAKDIVYGLGETMRGINKRGGRYVLFNTDNMNHTDDMPSLYGSHNFFAVDGKQKFGAFFDTPARVVFDIDYKDSGKIEIMCEQGVAVYIVEGNSVYDIVRQFLRAIGRSFLPPLWAFGFGQSRWGYKNERDVRRIVNGYRKADMPLDYICLDIDYMDRYIDFTVDKKDSPT